MSLASLDESKPRWVSRLTHHFQHTLQAETERMEFEEMKRELDRLQSLLMWRVSAEAQRLVEIVKIVAKPLQEADTVAPGETETVSAFNHS